MNPKRPHSPTDDTRTVAWRGGDREDSRRWLEREFQEGASEGGEFNRREFVRLMGAATALAGVSGVGCRKPVSHLVPFVDNKDVEWLVPGKATLYTTAMPWEDGAVPLVVTTHDGRPTKLEGNPVHPGSRGTTDGITQASILDLYDPDRSREPMTRGKHISRENMQEELVKIAGEIKDAGGEDVALLFGRHSSPTRRRLVAELRAQYPKIQCFSYEALESPGAVQGAQAVLGEGVRAVPDFRKATRVLALDCDFLGIERGTTASLGDFSEARKPEDVHHHPRKDMARLYVAEAAMSVTGGMADHRMRVAGSRIIHLAAALGAAVAKATGDAALTRLAKKFEGKTDGLDPRWIAACAEDLVSATGKSVVLAGGKQAAAVHALAHAINQALGAHAKGACVTLYKVESDDFGSLADLAKAVSTGKVKTLISMTPADPAYDSPGDLDWGALTERLKRFVHFGTRVNRSALDAHLHVPGTHFLEEWGDLLDERGVYSVIQPMILPLYGGTSDLHFLLQLLVGGKLEEGEEDPMLAAVRMTFSENAGAMTPGAWDKTLRDGYLKGSGYPLATPAAGDMSALVAPKAGGDGLYEIQFAADPSIYDGRYINNGWLQEAPDPVSKLTWDNAVLMSPATAMAMGCYDPKPRKNLFSWTDVANDSRFTSQGDGKQDVPMVRITVDGTSLELPVLVAFGHADGVVTLPMGYGQSGDREGQPTLPMRVGHGTGFDVNPLRRLSAPRIAFGTVEKISATYFLALTQEHGAMEGRALVREGSLDRYQKDPTFAGKEAEDAHIPENISLYKPVGYDRKTGEFDRPFLFDEKNQWGMVIDLNQCTGCTACLLACQAENNIPIVGKDQVRRGREMHWIRMDRYFVAKQDKHGNFINEDNPEMLVQPVGCLQCESAPCETVCPVNATVHSEEGLNVMAYNRCIGTRYCANNCPYKSRRFNFFDYNKRPLDELYSGPLSSSKGVPQSLQLGKNPNVTVRMRGVMEKCTYCIQRIEAAKIKRFERRRRKPQELGVPSEEVELTLDEIRVPGDAIKVACQQACPSEAIVFGNLLDPKSRLRTYKEIDESTERRPIVSKHPRNYDLLKYLRTLPRTSYLARVRNPNPHMPDAAFVGNATISIH